MEQNNQPIQILQEVEAKISDAFLSGIRDSNANELLIIKYELIEALNKEYSNEIIYWMAYCSKYLAILYSQINEVEKEEKELKEGIKLLDSVENKDSEYLALLGIMDGYIIKFCPPIRIPKHIEKCKKHTKEALLLFEKNPRAHLAAGIFDFYSHISYGGGKITEISLKNAIEYITEYDPKSCVRPKWGLSTAYEFLVKYFIKNKNQEQADLYWNKAINIFPNDRNIKILKKQMQHEN